MTADRKVPDAALGYAKLGWRVLPVRPITDMGACTCDKGAECDKPGKHPHITSWQTKATTDVEQIEKWWKQWPDAGVGIATGKESNLTVLDLDKKNGKDGIAEAKRLLRGPLPETPRVRTGSGGTHLYFLYDAELDSNTVDKIAPGIDTRGDGGFVCAPPSRHKLGEYEWVMPPSAWVLLPWPDVLRPPKGKAAAGRKVTKERFNPTNPHEVKRLVHALSAVDPDDEPRWGQVGWILGRAFQWADEGFKYYSEWAARSPKYLLNDGKGKTKDHYYKRSRKPYDGPPLTTASIYEWASENESYRPLLEEEPREFSLEDKPYAPSEVIEQLEKAAASIENLFVRGQDLVRVSLATELGGVDEGWSRDANTTVLIPYTNLTLAAELSKKVAFFTVLDSGNTKRTEIPDKRVRTLLERYHWPDIRKIHAFVPHPIFTRDGELVTAAGFNRKTGVYITKEFKIDDVKHPSQRTAMLLLKGLMLPFAQFDWEMPDDVKPKPGSVKNLNRSIWIAALFTTLLRYRFPQAPLFGFSSKLKGSGKGLLADSIGKICHGALSTKITWSGSSEEREKRLCALLRAGDPLICFDNIEEGEKLHDVTLCSVLTSPTHDFRLLGVSERVKLPTNSTFFATGNRLTVSGDTERRTFVCRIDPPYEDPSQRQDFHIADLMGYLHEHRDELLEMALNIVRCFFEAGAPLSDWRKGSFEKWSQFVNGLLVWLGEESMEGYTKRNNPADSETSEAEREMIAALKHGFFFSPGRTGTTTELTKAIAKEDDFSATFRAVYPLLMHAECPPGYANVEINITTVGRLLRALEGKRRRIDFDEGPPSTFRLRMRIPLNTKRPVWDMVEEDAKDADA